MDDKVDLRTNSEIHMEFNDNVENLISTYQRLMKQQESLLQGLDSVPLYNPVCHSSWVDCIDVCM